MDNAQSWEEVYRLRDMIIEAKNDPEVPIVIGSEYLVFCLLSFPQNERKTCKLRQLSLSQFVYFFLVLREREETKRNIPHLSKTKGLWEKLWQNSGPLDYFRIEDLKEISHSQWQSIFWRIKFQIPMLWNPLILSTLCSLSRQKHWKRDPHGNLTSHPSEDGLSLTLSSSSGDFGMTE